MHASKDSLAVEISSRALTTLCLAMAVVVDGRPIESRDKDDTLGLLGRLSVRPQAA